MLTVDQLVSCARAQLFRLLLLCSLLAPAGVQAQVSTNSVTNFIAFTSTNYVVSEEGLFAILAVRREGPPVDALRVEYFTIDGTALSGRDYLGGNGFVTFLPGEIVQVLFIDVTPASDFSQDGDVFLSVQLRDPVVVTESGGGEGGTVVLLGDPNLATLTIRDDESVPDTSASGEVGIAGPYEITPEEWIIQGVEGQGAVANFVPHGPPGAKFTIIRRGGSRGRIMVDWATTTNVISFYDPEDIFNTGGIGIPGVHFQETNGTVVMDDFQMSTSVVVRLPINFGGQVLNTNGYAISNISQIFGVPTTFGVEITGVRAAPEEEGMGVNPTVAVENPTTAQIMPNHAGFAPYRMHYTIDEGVRFARINIKRSFPLDQGVSVRYHVNTLQTFFTDSGGDHLWNTFALEPGSDYATPFLDFEPPGSPVWEQSLDEELNIQETEGILRWDANDPRDRVLTIPIIDDDEAEFDEVLTIELFKLPGEQDGFVNLWTATFTLKIIDNDQPAGASDVTFNPDNDALTDPPYNTTPGANNTVQAVAVQPDGKVVLGGDFSAVNRDPSLGIARLNFDGSLDESFDVGTGVGGFVRAVALQPDGKILVGGLFDSVNGVGRFGIARLLTNGVVDPSFDPGIGTDGAVRAITLQEDGKILIGGDFLQYNGTNRTYIARLLPNGQLDTTFDPGTGPDGPVNSIAVSAGTLDLDITADGGAAERRILVDTGSSQGTILINYDFLTVPDTLRVYHDGQLIFNSGLINGVGTFNINYGPGASTYVEIVVNEGSGEFGTLWEFDMLIDPLVDPRPVIGGEFREYDGTPANFIARLNLDGSIDTSFNPGTGADDVVYAVAKYGNKVILGGDFRTVDLRPRPGVARLNENGSLDLEFEPGSGFNNSVYSISVQPNGRPVLGGAFTSFNETRRVGLARLNIDGTLDTSFMDTAKNQFAGVPNPLSAENVQSLENFIRSVAPYRMTNLTILTNVVVDTNNVTNVVLSTNITVSDHVFVGGRFTRFGGGFGRADIRSRLNIARVVGGATPGPGNIGFAKSGYNVDENGVQTFITLVRTNGSLGPIGAQFVASDRPPGGPGIAVAGNDYMSTNRFPIWIDSHPTDRQFSDAFMGPNNNAFSTNRQRGDFTLYPPPERPGLRFRNFDEDNVFVTIFDDNLIEGDEVVRMQLNTPDGTRLVLGGEPIPLGAALGKPDAELTIVDNDFNYGTLGFSDVEYFVNENELDAVITLTREGGASGAVSIDVSTQDGSAGSADYNPIATRTIFFANGQTTNRFIIRIKNDTVAELEETIQLTLSNPTGFPLNVAPELRLDPERTEAVLTIIDDDYAPGRLSFTMADYSIAEGDGEVIVTVRRSGGNLGEMFVDFATVTGPNDTAQAGVDYEPVSGTLHWVDGDTSTKSFTISLTDNSVVESEKTFTVLLSDPRPYGDALGIQPSATVRITNDDSYGVFSFSQLDYAVDENGPYADVTVLRLDGMAGAVQVAFAATNQTAIGTNTFMTFAPNGVPDFVFTNGVLQFAPGETSKSFRVPIINDGIVEGNKIIDLTLTNAVLATIASGEATITIIDDEANKIPAGAVDTTFLATGTDDIIYDLALQNDGRILLGGDFGFVNDVIRGRLGRLMSDGTLDPSFDPIPGPDNSVRVIELQQNGRMFIGGLFTSITGTNRNHIARLNSDAKVDSTFHPGAGTDNPIYTLVEQADGKVIFGGEFSTYRGVSRRGVARANTNGVLDASFDPGTGANGTVYALALQSNGKVLVGGDFTTFNEQTRPRLVRLNTDGSIDTTFALGLSGPDGPVRTIVLQSDGKILIGGLFNTVHGQAARNVARLNPDGTLDTTFNTGTGANGAVNVIALQIDGKILLGGDFTQFNERTRNRITRLNSDGSLDPTINFGAGANGTITAILVQPDRKILLAGGFTEYDGQPARRLVRIHGGSIAGEGRIQFTSPFYRVTENSTNAVVTIRRTGGTTGDITVRLESFAATATAGSDYIGISTNLVFAQAETFRTVLVPVLNDTEIEPDETVNLQLSNVAGGDVLGIQPNATLIIESDDSQIQFSSPAYSVTENFVTGSASITVQRLGFTGTTHTVVFQTQPGTATANSDYSSVSNVVVFTPGQTSRTFEVPILDDGLVEGNETVLLSLSNLVGQGEISGGSAVLTIVDNDFAPGELSFTAEKYAGVESSQVIVVTVRRTAGSTGFVSARYQTSGSTATPRVDYLEKTDTVSFADGETLKSFTIEVLDDQLVEGNEDIIVTLSNPTGGATIIGNPQAIATIVDDDLGAGSLDQNFDPELSTNNPLVRAVQMTEEGEIFVGGDFALSGSSGRSYIVKLDSNGAVDPSFNPGVGPNALVADIEFTPGGELLISGNFNTVGGVQHNRVARLEPDGNLDPTFHLPLGLNAEVSDVLLQPDGRILIGGVFDFASAADRKRIARLLNNGMLDIGFNPGTGANDTVHSVALQEDGKVIIVGRFTSVNNVGRSRIARLEANGAVDQSFNLAGGANGPIHDVIVLEDGKLLIGGDFTMYGGVPRSRVARLHPNGSLDTSFDPGSGANGVVQALAIQPDGKYFIAGDFTVVNGTTQVRVARLNQNGSVDPTFSTGDGPNDIVYTIELQPQDAKVLIGGRFTMVDRIPRGGLARFNNDRAFIPVLDPISFSMVERTDGGSIRVGFTSQPGFTYALEASTDLETWVTVETISATGTSTLNDLPTLSEPHQFFRVRRVSP